MDLNNAPNSINIVHQILVKGVLFYDMRSISNLDALRNNVPHLIAEGGRDEKKMMRDVHSQNQLD